MGQRVKFTLKGVLWLCLPLIVAIGIQLITAASGGVIFQFAMVAYDKAHGIEWYFDRTIGAYINLYTEEQYAVYMAVISFISEVIMLLCGSLWYKNSKNKSTKFSMSPMGAVWALAFGFGLQGLTGILLELIYYIFPSGWTASYDDLIESILDTSSPLMIISVAVLAPIAEEILFRGLALNYGKKYFPPMVAVIGQAICFGVFHLNPVQSTYATVIGLIFGIVALECNSIWPGVIIHIGVNATSEIITLFNIPVTPMIMSLSGLGICLISVILFVTLKKRGKFGIKDNLN